MDTFYLWRRQPHGGRWRHGIVLVADVQRAGLIWPVEIAAPA